MNNRTCIKVCCIASPDEARMAIEGGADAIGLVSAMPSGPGPISIEAIAGIVETVPRSVETFLLTCETEAQKVIEQLRITGCSTVQLCDAMVDELEAYGAIRAALPRVRIVQVIHVEDEKSVEDAIRIGSQVDALLLDSGRTKGAVKQLGGTGRAHDWTLSRRIVAAQSLGNVPVWLAGGLIPANVRGAIRTVQPHGVDVCSGLRTDGKLDRSKLEAFVAAVRAA